MSAVSASIVSQPAPSFLGHPFRWFQDVRDRRRSRLLEETFREARLALGRRMFEAGIDDGETGGRIAALAGDDAETWARRNQLFIRLADAALEDDAPLPGADAEFERALEFKRAVAAAAAARLLRG
jgi:hypothetical protein